MSSYSEDLHSAALALSPPARDRGKLEIQAIKPLANQRDLALGLFAGCWRPPATAIAQNPRRGGVADDPRQSCRPSFSNGTAVLGLGNIGPLASKPVMEGKAVLFKKFAGIDVFDIEISRPTPSSALGRDRGGAGAEPSAASIWKTSRARSASRSRAQLKERMKIPVFHDDQHGTAIIVAAAITNALLLNGKKLKDVKIVASGAGAAAIACLNLLVSLGAPGARISGSAISMAWSMKAAIR